MKFLPFENITYRSEKSSKEILNYLKEIIEPKRYTRRASDAKPTWPNLYEGSISGNTFKINRIEVSRWDEITLGMTDSHAFNPYIKGQITDKFSGCEINVKIKLYPYAIGILGFLFCAFAFGFTKTLFASANQAGFEPFLLFPVAMFLVIFGIVTIHFKDKSRKIKKHMTRLFGPEIIEE